MNNKGKEKIKRGPRGPYRKSVKKTNTQIEEDLKDVEESNIQTKYGCYSKNSKKLEQLTEESYEDLVRLKKHLDEFHLKTTEEFKRTFYRIKIQDNIQALKDCIQRKITRIKEKKL
ncbi:hypothetical protein ES288_D04G018600v1 [Gossypium darwinii]|uniref:Uncharacterized protein n=1 Tax=Gossypium darwinii TaxID=34276 RepID=A0A5D2CS66_GOSDA|nr:hypothetical protein ES288_D04G018600v1 [Gossypium darwinii]